jgi:hypothetical protein
MTQSSPNLLTIFLGGSGVVGALITLGSAYAKILNKKYVEPLERDKQTLISENGRLRSDLQNAKIEKAEALSEVDKIVSLFESLRESNLSPNDAATIKRMMAKVQRIQSMKNEAEAYKAAANWLEYRRQQWIKDALQRAIQEHPSLVPKEVRKSFQKDIGNYLSWVHTSLYEYQHANAPLHLFVPSPTIRSTFPYIAAIRCIKDNGDRGELNVEQSVHLEKMLNKLIERIPSEIKIS